MRRIFFTFIFAVKSQLTYGDPTKLSREDTFAGVLSLFASVEYR